MTFGSGEIKGFLGPLSEVSDEKDMISDENGRECGAINTISTKFVWNYTGLTSKDNGTSLVSMLGKSKRLQNFNAPGIKRDRLIGRIVDVD